MSKELEACFKEIYHEIEYVYDSKVNSKANKNWSNDIKHYDNIRGNVLTIQRYLESIENANPSEALGCLERIKNQLFEYFESTEVRTDDMEDYEKLFFEPIKQALLKSLEQEKAIVELCEYCGMDNLYPYDNLNEIEIAFKDTFDNYQRQRIESLGRLNKQEKVLEIIKEKRVDLSYLRCCFEDNQSVERYNEYIRDKTMTYDHEEELTQEDFELLKRYFK